MADVLTPEQRKKNMSAIRGKDTKPEKIVRSLVHRLGYRYRLHDGRLPGKPDLVFSSRRKAIFVHGCFWHMHACPYGQVVPKTNAEFWQVKRQGNVERDQRNIGRLEADGWQCLVIWECMVRDADDLRRAIQAFLGD
jgi:DNA mismatch endonuclease (patch repair protein)